MNKILNHLFPLMKDILKKSDLYVESNQFPSEQKRIWKDLESYRRVWEYTYTNKLFHLRLSDHSLLRFLYFDDKVSFEYLNSPYQLEDIDEFEDYNVIIFKSEEYDDRLPTPIRYDYELDSFNEISHPVGHIHFGLENPIRIGTYILFDPMSFLLFCLRQMYPDYWVKILENDKFKECRKHIRIKISEIDKMYKAAYKREHFIR